MGICLLRFCFLISERVQIEQSGRMLLNLLSAPMTNLRSLTNMKILISLDSSSSSQRAIDFALSRPWAEDDEFLIVSVVDVDRGDMSMASAMTSPNKTFNSEAERIVSEA